MACKENHYAVKELPSLSFPSCIEEDKKEIIHTSLNPNELSFRFVYIWWY